MVRVNLAANAGAPFLQRFHGARRSRTEAEILAHVHVGGRAAWKRGFQELLRFLREQLLVEPEHHHVVHAGFRKRIEPVGIARELLQLIGAKHLVGIDIEREGDCAFARLSCADCLADQVLMSGMQPVEHAEGARRSGEQLPIECLICEVERHCLTP